jgi:chromosome segregation ATPase
MSDVMLHGVLNMPPNLWCDSPIDIAQRHSHYKQASQRIEELELELLETQKDLSFRRDLYKFQEHRLVQLSNYLAEATAEVKKWKDNHDNQVKINQLLRDRPDLGHRAKSVDALIKQRDIMETALMKIECHYVDGNDTYEDWKAMGQTAQQALLEINHYVSTDQLKTYYSLIDHHAAKNH